MEKLGKIRIQGNEQAVYDRFGKRLGYYRNGNTYDRYGNKIGSGNMLAVLLPR